MAKLFMNQNLSLTVSSQPLPRRKLLTIRLLLMTVPLFLGTSYAAAKIGMQELLPLNLAILRLIMASTAFALVLFCRKQSSSLEIKDIPQFLLLGFLAITSFFYIHYTGLQYTTSTNAGLIMAATPVFTALFSILAKQKAVSSYDKLGIGMALSGILLVISQGRVTELFQQKTLAGDSLLLLNALVWAALAVKGKTVLAKYSPFTAIAYLHIFGTLLLLPIACIPSRFAPTPLLQQLPAISSTTLLISAYLAIFCSVYLYFIWYLGISRIGTVKTELFNYFNPIMASLAGILLFHDKLTISVALGGLLVLLGVYITCENAPPSLHLIQCSPIKTKSPARFSKVL